MKSAAVLLMVLVSADFAGTGLATRLDASAPAALQAARGQVNQLGFRGHSIRYSADDVVVLLVGGAPVEAAGCEAARMPERLLERHLVLSRTPRVFSLGVAGGPAPQLAALERYFKRFRADAVAVWLSQDSVATPAAVQRSRAALEQMEQLSRAKRAEFLTFWVDVPSGPCVSDAAAGDPARQMRGLNEGFESHAFAVPRVGVQSRADRELDQRAIDAVMKELGLTLIPRLSVGPTRPLNQK